MWMNISALWFDWVKKQARCCVFKEECTILMDVFCLSCKGAIILYNISTWLPTCCLLMASTLVHNRPYEDHHLFQALILVSLIFISNIALFQPARNIPRNPIYQQKGLQSCSYWGKKINDMAHGRVWVINLS